MPDVPLIVRVTLGSTSNSDLVELQRRKAQYLGQDLQQVNFSKIAPEGTLSGSESAADELSKIFLKVVISYSQSIQNHRYDKNSEITSA
jgi:hypothetical protein